MEACGGARTAGALTRAALRGAQDATLRGASLYVPSGGGEGRVSLSQPLRPSLSLPSRRPPSPQRGSPSGPASAPAGSSAAATETPAEGADEDGTAPQSQRGAPRSRYQRRRDAFVALALDEALAALRAIEAQPPLYGAAAQTAAMAVAAAGCALTFFGGGWWDAFLAGALGGLVGAMGTAASASGTRFIRAYEFLAAAACALLARAADGLLRPACLQPVLLSALIWLLQGWTMTNAVVELATRNPISGTSHLFVGIVTTAMMGFGLDVGSALADALGVPAASDQAAACAHAIPQGFYLPLFVPTTLSFSLLLNADRTQLGPMTALACLAFCVAWACASNARTEQLASFLAAAVVGVAGNAYANATGRPAMAGTCSGIFILVPGAMALRSISQLVGNAAGGVGLALTSRVLTVAVSIGAGVFMASLLVTPREIVHVRAKAARAEAAAAAGGAAGAAARGGYHRTLALAPVNM